MTMPLSTTDLSWLAAEAEQHRDHLATIAVDRVLAELPIDHATRRNLEAGTLAAVDCFLALLGDPDGPIDTVMFRAHGRAQCAAGRSITELLALYRISGMAMWEYLEGLPGSERLTGAQALGLGGRLLKLVDQLSGAAVDGFLEAGAELRRRDRARRQRLHSLLLSDPPATRDVIEAAAAHASWAVPERVRVAVVALPIEADASEQERSPARVLSGPHPRGRLVLVVGEQDPQSAESAAPQAEALLERAARAHGATGPLAIGPSVPLVEAARSAHRAGHLLDEVEAGVVAPAPVVRTDDHELPLLLAAAPELVAAIVERRLAPLAELPDGKREQTVETLAAWLADPHRPQAIADRLGMHVQSVRYRLARLRELFGDDLDDPEARFELSVALRATRGA
jgi:hypothetical protein